MFNSFALVRENRKKPIRYGPKNIKNEEPGSKLPSEPTTIFKTWIETIQKWPSHHPLLIVIDDSQKPHVNIPYLGDDAIDLNLTIIAALAAEVNNEDQEEAVEDEVFLDLVEHLAKSELGKWGHGRHGFVLIGSSGRYCHRSQIEEMKLALRMLWDFVDAVFKVECQGKVPDIPDPADSGTILLN